MTGGDLMLPSGGELAPAGDPLAAMRSLLDAWCIGCSPHTRRARENDLSRFAAFLDVGQTAEAGAWALLDPPATAANATRAMLAARDKAKAFDAALAQQGLAPASRARHLTTLRSLTKEANMRGFPWVLQGVKNPKWDPYDSAHGPASATVEARIAWELEHGSWRDYATLLLFYDAALRISSIRLIRVRDCDVDNRRILVWLKGDRTSHRTVSRRCADALRHRIGELEYEPEALIDGRGDSGIRAWCHRIGLGHPHGLRHTAATLVTERTGDVRMVQQLLAHKNLITSQAYIDRIRDDAGQASAIIAGEDSENDDDEGYPASQVPRRAESGDRAGHSRLPPTRPKGRSGPRPRGSGESADGSPARRD